MDYIPAEEAVEIMVPEDGPEENRNPACLNGIMGVLAEISHQVISQIVVLSQTGCLWVAEAGHQRRILIV
jgi:hypothetical protein